MVKINELLVFPDSQKHQKIRVCGNIIEFRSYLNLPDKMPIQKLNDTEYLVMATGEIKDYQQTENRSENMQGISVSMSDARAIINNNFQGGRNEIWITLTYKENMTDTKRLYTDFKKFMMRFRHHLKGRCIEYMIVCEPQERGAWHVHGLIKATDKKTLSIDQDVLGALWGHGFVGIQRLKNCDNIGAYISAYCSNMPSNDPDSKTFKKYQRLKLYPRGMNFYRYSRGIIKPEWTKPTTAQKMIVEFSQPNYQKGIEILDDDGTVLNRIIYKQYNTKRLAIK